MSQVLEYRNAAIPWLPPTGVKDHEGAAGGAEADYFVPPPEGIGRIVSAYSSLSKQTDIVAWPVRMVILALAMLPGLAVVCAKSLFSVDLRFSVVAIGILLAIAGLAVAVRVMRFSHVCSYIGTRGAVRYSVIGSRTGPRKEEGLRFENAADVRAAILVTSPKSIHEDTLYRYEWSAFDGAMVCSIRGHYRPVKKSARGGHPYFLARAAELAWTEYLHESAAAKFASQEFLQFDVRSGQWIRIYCDGLELADDGESKRIAKTDILELTLKKAVFRVVTPDPQRPEEPMTFAFDYGKLANARLFHKSLSEFMGVQL